MSLNEDKRATETERIERLQARIDQALQEPIEERAKRVFSPYAAHLGPELVRDLHRAASPGGIDGLEAAMDRFDLMLQSGNVSPDRVRYVLLLFLSQHDEVQKLGLRLPPSQED